MKVHEIFRSIQGEGRLAGTPMTFIRLYGCNMVPLCSWCDTPQATGGYVEMSIEEIVGQVEDDWVCITGGEPTIQCSELLELATVLTNSAIGVAIETNGTLYLSALEFDWICISPKSVWPSQQTMRQANEIKLLVGSGMYNAEEKLVGLLLRRGLHVVSLLPIWDVYYEANLARAIELCQKYQVRLTVQLHKYLRVR